MSGRALALFGGAPVRSQPFPAHPVIGEAEKAAVVRVLESGRLSTFHSNFLGGERVQRFEQAFAAYHGVRYAMAVNSGTAALHVALAAAGIGPGDEVIVPSYTFTATASSVLMANATPVFVDVDPRTCCVSVEDVERAISERTKAVIPVHLLGNVCAIDRLQALAQRHHLALIEDTAQAPGARLRNRLVGTWGDLAAFSFQETKNMTTGEGGMILTDRDDLAERCRLIRNHGEAIVSGRPRSYLANLLGWNYRMTELEAAIGIEQLKHLDEWNDIRREHARFLNAHLTFPGLTPQHVEPDVKHVYHLYGLLYDEAAVMVPRDAVVLALRAEGIPVTAGYPHPLYKSPIFQEKAAYRTVRNPVAEALCSSKAIWIPVVRPTATRQDMKDIVRAFEKVFEHIDGLRQESIPREAARV